MYTFAGSVIYPLKDSKYKVCIDLKSYIYIQYPNTRWGGGGCLWYADIILKWPLRRGRNWGPIQGSIHFYLYKVMCKISSRVCTVEYHPWTNLTGGVIFQTFIFLPCPDKWCTQAAAGAEGWNNSLETINSIVRTDPATIYASFAPPWESFLVVKQLMALERMDM